MIPTHRAEKCKQVASTSTDTPKDDKVPTASPTIEKSMNQKKNSTESMVGTDAANHKSMASFRLILLVFMVMQNSATVLVGRHSRASVPEEELYVVNHLILTAEVGKFVLSCLLEHFTSGGRLLAGIQENILDRPMDAMKISVPALLYLVQNSLLYVALSNLSAPIFQVTYQCKLVTTALVSVVMLDRKYSPKQWICLVVLSVGVAIVVLGESSSKSTTTEQKAETATQSLGVGLIAVSIACMSSALAGVYFEKVLKKPAASAEGHQAPPVSVWMRNMQLSFFSMIIAIVQGVLQGGDSGEAKPYFHGFTFWVWILVSLQAGGGLLVAAVIKYADNVLKGLATGVSVVVATACSTLMFGTTLSGQFLFGAFMILTSVYFFSNNLPSFCLEGKSSVEMKPLVLPK